MALQNGISLIDSVSFSMGMPRDGCVEERDEACSNHGWK